MSKLSNLMSPYPSPGLVHKVDIVRRRPVIVAGRKQQKCDEVVLYADVMSRIISLRTIDDNTEKMQQQGLSSANERQIVLRDKKPLNKMLQGDFIKIPWGVRPNLVVPAGAPNDLAPEMWITTPDGTIKVSWNGTKYTDGGSYDIELVGEVWCLKKDTVTVDCFTGTDFTCEEWPDEYAFLKLTGPPIYYRILNYDVQIDDLGRTHHYSASIELEDGKGTVKQ